MNVSEDSWADEDGSAPGLVASLWQYRRQSIVIVAVFAVAGLALAFAVDVLATQRDSATTRLVLTDPRGDSIFRQGNTADTDLQKYAASRAEVASSKLVLERAAARLGERFDADDLSNRVSTSSSPESISLLIQASASTATEAVRIAAAVAVAYQEVTKEDVQEELDRALDGLETNRARLRSDFGPGEGTGSLGSAEREAITQALVQTELKANEVALNAALYGSGVDFVDTAVVDVSPSTSPLRYAAAASMLGLLIAVAVAWVRAGWHRTIDESDQASALLGAPLLGDVPDLGGPDQRELVTDPTAMPAAAFQALTAGLLARRPKGGVILVTGLTRGDGSTITAVSVAIGLAREGRNVVLVDGDADVRSARSLLGAVRGPGLAEVARGLDDESVVQSVGIGGGSRLSFVSAGGTREDLPGVYRSDGTKRALDGLALAHDLVLVDAPPLLESAETASLALHADAVLVVVRRRTRVRTLESFRSRLAVYSVPVVGIVFNRNRSKVHGGERARDLEDVLEEREEKPALERRAAIHPT